MAAPSASHPTPGFWTRIQDLILPIAVIASVLVIVTPLPAGLMDLLLSANITVAVIMLLTTIYVRTPLEFSVFPSLLLVTTLFRLVLNVATTRLILTRASQDGLLAAGGVVRTFGEFVTGGATGTDKVIVGLIIFAIIVLIQFVVITKGATRISEVAARFTLDGMPGRQMAIDADLSAGVITQREAQRRRQEVTQQADFFGAMDGASKFVRGDAVAGLAIILINIVGGLTLGLARYDMSLGQAASLFTTLTIGDGLVTQVPALLISLAAGLLVTRSSQESNLPKEFLRQLFSRPMALAVAGGFLAILTLTSLPRVPLLLLGAACAGMAIALSRRETRAQAVAAVKQKAEVAKTAQRVEDYLTVDPMELELGLGLIRLADRKRGGDLLDRVQRIRQTLASQIGIILPKVRIRDNLRLEPTQYRIKIADMTVAQGTIDAAAGEPTQAIATHLSEMVRQHADELLTRDAVKHLLDELRQTSPAVVDELIPGVLRLGEVQQVLQGLLRENVPIRQLGPILETLGDSAAKTKDPWMLTEHVRARLARTLSTCYRDADLRLHVVTLDPALEEHLRDRAEATDEGPAVRLPPAETDAICRSIGAAVETLQAAGQPPVVLVSPAIRPIVRQLTASRLPQLAVLSYAEVTRDTQIESAGMASVEIRRAPSPPHFRKTPQTTGVS
ncbi:MAG: flagellar biosynthesis protein FlhA [Planctomycetaceae bacterium]|nr:flagellar biosynthesis protein FlhA [Planctomycetaceae bacterium]